MDIKEIPLIEGELPSDAEPNGRYVVIGVRNGSGAPEHRVVRLRPYPEHSDQTLRDMQKQYPGLKLRKCAAGRIEMASDGLVLHRGTDLFGSAVYAANALRLERQVAIATRWHEPDPLSPVEEQVALPGSG